MMTKFGHTKHVTNWEIRKPPTYGRLNSKRKESNNRRHTMVLSRSETIISRGGPMNSMATPTQFFIQRAQGLWCSESTTHTIRNLLKFHQQLWHSPIWKPERATDWNTPAHRLFHYSVSSRKSGKQGLQGIFSNTTISITSSTMCALNRPNFCKSTEPNLKTTSSPKLCDT